ncbi:MAG: ChaN family lipoprotein [Nitrospirota bacterium]
MNPKRRFFILILTAALAGMLIFAINVFSYERVLRMQDKRVITFDQMMRDKQDADIIVVGESHTDPRHHELQLKVIRTLHEKGVPLAIGLEMFTAGSQGALNKWIEGKLSLEQFLPIYYENWNLPWPLYSDILLYAREHDIPLVGLNVPRSITTKVAKEGFDSLTEEERRQLPSGISCTIDEAYMEFIRSMHSAHAHGKEFVNFCEAQMIWDNAMALNALEFLQNNPDRTMVVLAGTVHAWKRAIPEQIRRQGSGNVVSVVLPEVPGTAEQGGVTEKDTDFLMLR